jgi:glycosyltransferase involved in cell wall biosynthesis
MMIQKPKVSICIPTYQPTTFLREAIQSVLEQNFIDFELIIVDDCSTMPVDEWVQPFIKDSRISFQPNTKNLGLAGNWNRCIDLAQGEYIAIFHQDDLMYPDNVTLKSRVLDLHPEVGFVYSDICTIDKTSAVIGGHYAKQPDEDKIFSGEELFRMVARQGNPIACQTVIARSQCYDRLGGFDERLGYATDLEMWLRIASEYSTGFIAQPLVALRVHSDQETKKFFGNGRDYLDVLQAYDIAFDRDLPDGQHSIASEAYATLSRQAFSMSKYCLRSARIRASILYLGVYYAARQRVKIHAN